MQEISNKNAALTINGYYAELSKKEKGNLIRYLTERYGFNYSTLQNKLTGRSKFNPRDNLVVQTVINEELWRKK